jgi:hypothetical protein
MLVYELWDWAVDRKTAFFCLKSGAFMDLACHLWDHIWKYPQKQGPKSGRKSGQNLGPKMDLKIIKTMSFCNMWSLQSYNEMASV